ncbi:hypothetical protein LUZ60_006751 [Juncus effusus]|nr:hypothetical protein LUZ60_006751 [Juncus effusus]
MKEISFVMEKMGFNLAKEDSMMDSMRIEDFSTIFEDSEPSLDEVKEAFSVFDMNKDGFFDARDLQRVLINLGIKEGLDMKVCELMIEQHDRNGNGMINLRDFSRLLETGLI